MSLYFLFIIKMDSFSNQLDTYRKAQQKNYEKTMRMKQIQDKYKNLLIFDPIQRAATRLQYYFRKKVLQPTINDIKIPGVYKMRITVDNKEIYEKPFKLALDLRIFGKFPDMEYYIDELNKSIKFNNEQQSIIIKEWEKVDPDTEKGMRLHQILDCSKALCDFYNKN